MPWIAVHEDVFGSKLRGFRKAVKCSDAEALGILTYLWLWARKNTDITGLLGNTERDDIAKEISSVLSDNLSPRKVVDELISNGWLDEIDGQIYVHDWQEWQSYWYSYLEKREKDKERKRRERASNKQPQQEVKPPEANKEEAHDDSEDKAPKKEKKPPKTKYAESVSMYPEERDKLVAEYGEQFTEKLIEELNNYKLANGKRYKDDYRAILNWVVEKCEKKYPNLAKRRPAAATQSGGNPFADYK